MGATDFFCVFACGVCSPRLSSSRNGLSVSMTVVCTFLDLIEKCLLCRLVSLCCLMLRFSAALNSSSICTSRVSSSSSSASPITLRPTCRHLSTPSPLSPCLLSSSCLIVVCPSSCCFLLASFSASSSLRTLSRSSLSFACCFSNASSSACSASLCFCSSACCLSHASRSSSALFLSHSSNSVASFWILAPTITLLRSDDRPLLPRSLCSSLSCHKVYSNHCSNSR